MLIIASFSLCQAWLSRMAVAEPAGMESFVRTPSEPAQSPSVAPASAEPPAPDVLMAAAAEYGIEILGPPGIPA
jgi:hypothetical protein